MDISSLKKDATGSIRYSSQALDKIRDEWNMPDLTVQELVDILLNTVGEVQILIHGEE